MDAPITVKSLFPCWSHHFKTAVTASKSSMNVPSAKYSGQCYFQLTALTSGKASIERLLQWTMSTGSDTSTHLLCTGHEPASKSSYWIAGLPYLRSFWVGPGVFQLPGPTVLQMYSPTRFISVVVSTLDLPWTPCSLLSALRMNIKSPARDTVLVDGNTSWLWGARNGFKRIGLRSIGWELMTKGQLQWWSFIIVSVTSKGNVPL